MDRRALVVGILVSVVIKINAAQSFHNSSFGLEEKNLNFNENGIPYTPEERNRRKSKLFPLFTIIRFTNEPCAGSDPIDRGVCFTRKQCLGNAGVSIGTCAQGLGVCCQFYATCGNVIIQNNTLFRNPDFPNKYRPQGVGDICQVRIRKQLNVCQLRLNFIRFEIDGPVGPPASSAATPPGTANDGGSCKTDALTITSAGAAVPNICGNMNGQHLYLDYGSSDTLTLNIMLSSIANRDREWNIEILMIPCRAEIRAPTGCLQYFQGVSGQIQSFNYGGGIHLANLDYSSCVRMEDGMRSIEWSACTPGDVRLVGLPLLTTPSTTILTCPAATATTANDYLLIPGGLSFPLLPTVAAGTPLMFSTIDRYCDIHFALATNVVRSVVRPFLVHVRTDNQEIPNPAAGTAQVEASGGYCIRWQQSPQGLL